MIYDTIAAVSTAYGTGALSVIRVSGPETLNIIKKFTEKIILKIILFITAG